MKPSGRRARFPERIRQSAEFTPAATTRTTLRGGEASGLGTPSMPRSSGPVTAVNNCFHSNDPPVPIFTVLSGSSWGLRCADVGEGFCHCRSRLTPSPRKCKYRPRLENRKARFSMGPHGSSAMATERHSSRKSFNLLDHLAASVPEELCP